MVKSSERMLEALCENTYWKNYMEIMEKFCGNKRRRFAKL